MQFNVPQFIDMEDKIVGPLTAKQLGWLAMGGVILLVIWQFLDTGAFIIAAIFIGLIFTALAFLRPHGLPLFHFITASIFFIGRPKVYIWKRNSRKIKLEKNISQKKREEKPKRKELKIEKIEKISKILDENN